MIAPLFVALVIVANDAHMTVTENLSPEHCEIAACLAKYGATCEEHEQTDRAQAAYAREEALAYRKAHPKFDAQCKAIEAKGAWDSGCSGMWLGEAERVQVARCVK
jgi:hypothetical protein